MIVELYCPDAGEVIAKIDIDVVQEFEVSNYIEEYRRDDDQWTVSGFIEWLEDRGIEAKRIEEETYPLFYF